MGERAILLETNYLPCLAYFAALTATDMLVLEQHENFQRQSYRNRCYLRGANKIEMLTVPVVGARQRQPIRSVRVDYRQPWFRLHWRALQSAYGKAPFFPYFADAFVEVWDRKPVYLYELNKALLSLCLQLLNLPVKVTESTAYRAAPPTLTDYRNVLQPGQRPAFYEIQPYEQLFGEKFEDNLSVIDLLFNEGPAAAERLRRAYRSERQTNK